MLCGDWSFNSCDLIIPCMKKLEFTTGSLSCRVTALLNDSLTHVCESHEKYPALIVIPGGGYNHVSLREADPVALRFLAHGFNTFTLTYPVGDEIRKEKPLDTLTTLVEHLYAHSDDYGIDKQRMAVIGFSAGAHLAASYGTLVKDKKLKAMILGYPVITSSRFAHEGSFDMLCTSDTERELYSLEKHVDSTTLPSFIFHSSDDSTVPVENSLLMASALSAAGIPFALHVFPHARHGASVATVQTGSYNPTFSLWFPLALKWLNETLEWTE